MGEITLTTISRNEKDEKTSHPEVQQGSEWPQIFAVFVGKWMLPNIYFLIFFY